MQKDSQGNRNPISLRNLIENQQLERGQNFLQNTNQHFFRTSKMTEESLNSYYCYKGQPIQQQSQIKLLIQNKQQGSPPSYAHNFTSSSIQQKQQQQQQHVPLQNHTDSQVFHKPIISSNIMETNNELIQPDSATTQTSFSNDPFKYNSQASEINIKSAISPNKQMTNRQFFEGKIKATKQGEVQQNQKQQCNEINKNRGQSCNDTNFQFISSNDELNSKSSKIALENFNSLNQAPTKGQNCHFTPKRNMPTPKQINSLGFLDFEIGTQCQSSKHQEVSQYLTKNALLLRNKPPILEERITPKCSDTNSNKSTSIQNYYSSTTTYKSSNNTNNNNINNQSTTTSENINNNHQSNNNKNQQNIISNNNNNNNNNNKNNNNNNSNNQNNYNSNDNEDIYDQKSSLLNQKESKYSLSKNVFMNNFFLNKEKQNTLHIESAPITIISNRPSFSNPQNNLNKSNNHQTLKQNQENSSKEQISNELQNSNQLSKQWGTSLEQRIIPQGNLLSSKNEILSAKIAKPKSKITIHQEKIKFVSKNNSEKLLSPKSQFRKMSTPHASVEKKSKYIDTPKQRINTEVQVQRSATDSIQEEKYIRKRGKSKVKTLEFNRSSEDEEGKSSSEDYEDYRNENNDSLFAEENSLDSILEEKIARSNFKAKPSKPLFHYEQKNQKDTFKHKCTHCSQDNNFSMGKLLENLKNHKKNKPQTLQKSPSSSHHSINLPLPSLETSKKSSKYSSRNQESTKNNNPIRESRNYQNILLLGSKREASPQVNLQKLLEEQKDKIGDQKNKIQELQDIINLFSSKYSLVLIENEQDQKNISLLAEENNKLLKNIALLLSINLKAKK